MSTPIHFLASDYASVEAMPPSVRAVFEVTYIQDPEAMEDMLGVDIEEDDPGDAGTTLIV